MELKKIFEDGKKIAKAVGKGLLDGLNKGFDAIEEADRKVEKWRTVDISHQMEEVVINAEMAKQIRWMGSGQLKAIFSGKRVRTDNDPETWKQLRWMGSDQLEAVFGKDNYR